MEKEDVALLLQLLHAMKEIVDRMDKYYREEDIEKLNSAKKELLDIQTRVRDLL